MSKHSPVCCNRFNGLSQAKILIKWLQEVSQQNLDTQPVQSRDWKTLGTDQEDKRWREKILSCLQSTKKYLDTGEVTIQVWDSIDICLRFYMWHLYNFQLKQHNDNYIKVYIGLSSEILLHYLYTVNSTALTFNFFFYIELLALWKRQQHKLIKFIIFLQCLKIIV